MSSNQKARPGREFHLHIGAEMVGLTARTHQRLGRLVATLTGQPRRVCDAVVAAAWAGFMVRIDRDGATLVLVPVGSRGSG